MLYVFIPEYKVASKNKEKEKMSFYLLPPSGSISLTSMMEDAETRLLYLCQVTT